MDLIARNSLLAAFLESQNILSSKMPAAFWQSTHLTTDSRTIDAGSVFIAIKGSISDGHTFVEEVLEKCSAIFVQAPFSHSSYKVIVVPDTLALSRKIASIFYQHPSRQMKIIGVTGTNGKTTSTYLLEALYQGYENNSVGLIGTIERRYQGRIFPSQNTTPDAVVLQSYLREMLDVKVSTVAMEVSSHALVEDRVMDLALDSAIFTNITPDHLDFHGDMQSYLEAKLKIFSLVEASCKVKKKVMWWRDSLFATEIEERLKTFKSIFSYTYGLSKEADFYFDAKTLSAEGSSGDFYFRDQFLTHGSISLAGEFNILNVLACIGEWLDFSLPHEALSRQLILGLSLIKNTHVPGRLERIETPFGASIYVDYAHTPDALENTLRTLKNIPHHQLLCLFGCGGDRDKTKRPLMGKIAGTLADYSFVTSDNPRTEDPTSILMEIEVGIKLTSGEYKVELDRSKAIVSAVAKLQKGDLLLVAGKGHEDYQIIGKTKHHFDDREKVREALAKLL
jgi:UDP-N-acetylmuramoyl-L-alanyl-D-glutamate--2,6-diaminopimelate ligase